MSGDIGEVKITAEAIASIVASTVMKTDGVASLAYGRMEGFSEKMGMRSSGKGLRVEIKNRTVSVDVHVIIYFGYRIPDVARAIQKAVKNSIEEMTEYNVIVVNILVQGIDFSKEKS